MKKIALFLIIAFTAVAVYARDDFDDLKSKVEPFLNGGTDAAPRGAAQSGTTRSVAVSRYADGDAEEQDAEDGAKAKKGKLPSWMNSEDAEIGRPMRTERFFELGILNPVSIASPDPFKFSTAVMDAIRGDYSSLLASDVDISARLFAAPVTVKVNVLGFLSAELFTSLDTNIAFQMDKNTTDAMQKLIDISKALEETDKTNPANIDKINGLLSSLNGLQGKAALGISSFAEIGAGASTTLLGRKLYVRAAPSVYFPVFYARQGQMKFEASSTIDNANPLNTKAMATGMADFEMLTPFSLSGGFSAGDIFASPGLDLSLEGRYAIWRILEAGLSISHIPLAPAKTKYATRASGQIDMTASASGVQDKSTNPLEFKSSVEETNTVLRPVRFDAFAIVKPFNSLFLYVKPNLGFTLHNIVEPAIPLNFGVEVGVNLPVVLSASIGTHHTDGMWEHAIRAAIDLRAIELDLLAGLSGPEFLTNGWTLGLGFKAGF
jgi:hypothetical protein